MLTIGTTVKVKPAEAVREEYHGKVGHISRIVGERFPFFFEITFRGVYIDATGVFSGEELEEVWDGEKVFVTVEEKKAYIKALKED